MEPINLDNILKGDIERELTRVQSALKGVGDESYTSFKRLLNSSNEAFNGLSRNAQAQVRLLQDVIQELRQSEAAQEALFDKFKKGELSSHNYAEAQGELSARQAELKQQASGLNNEIKQEIRLNGEASDALREKTSILAMLREEYSRLNSVELQNEAIGGQLQSRIQELSSEIETLSGDLENMNPSSATLLDAVGQLPGPVGNTVSQFRQLYSIIKTFMSSGIGVFVGSLAATFYLLKAAIESSEEGTTKMNSYFEYFKSRFNSYKRMFTEGAAGIYNYFTGNTQAMQDNMAELTLLRNCQKSYADDAAEAVLKQQMINDNTERNNEQIKANALALEQYRTQLADINTTLEERISIGQKIINLEKENAELKFIPIMQNYENFKRKDRRVYNKVDEKHGFFI